VGCDYPKLPEDNRYFAQRELKAAKFPPRKAEENRGLSSPHSRANFL
jgi:hypothetical protein